MKITFNVVNQRICRTDDNKIVADSKNYLYAQFFFKTDDWDDITKTAVFEKGGKPYFVILDEDDTCKVPWEVIKPGKVFVSVFGGDLITTHTVELHISVSGYKEGETPTEPTPDVYAQIIKMIEDMENGVDKEEVENIVAEYISDNKEELKGEKGDKGEDGSNGADGKDGCTPIKGIDYWTEEDKTEIKQYINIELLGGAS